ncbi:MAG TPA: ABC transporter permease [Terriglobia bacterium]|nr:ABC transporter permease [Terriglobia bacterium]
MRFISPDIRYGFRMLRSKPGFTVAAIICMALGIGATTAIFSVVSAVLLKPLPYRNPEELVRLYTEFPAFPKGGLRRFWTSPPEYDDLKRGLKSWDALEAWTVGGANLSGGGTSEPIRVTATNVTGGMLQMLGVPPIAGRLLTPEDDLLGAARTAVISDGLWKRAFGGEKSVIGRTVQLNGQAATIVGIMPPQFQFPVGELIAPEMWRPLQLGTPDPNRRSNHFLYLLGRLKSGTTLAGARQELQQFASAAADRAAPRTHTFRPTDHPLIAYALHEEVVGGVRRAVMVLFAAVGFVLLIACVNVANLLLARTEARRREIAVRQAMGAGARRLVRQLVTEGVMLSVLGAMLGLAFAYGGLHVLVAAGAESIPRSDQVHLNGLVLLVTFSVAIATGIFFGVAPVVALSFGNVYATLKSASGRTTSSIHSQHFRRGLVVVQLAMALVLLIGNGLMIRAFWKLLSVNAGFNPDRVLTLQIPLPPTTYPDSKSTTQFWTDLENRARSLPAVDDVATVGGLPPLRPINANDTQIEGFVPRPGGPIQNIDYWQFVGPHYFRVLGVRLFEGRTFDDRDGPGSPFVAVVNQTMAQIYWPGESAIGHRVRPPGGPGAETPWFTIVGVVDDVKNGGIDKPAGTELYFSMTQLAGTPFALRNGFLTVKTKGDPMSIVGAIRSEVRSLDPSLPIANVRSMDNIMATSQSRPRFLTLLLSVFSATAMILAAVGLYGVISYSVAQRTNEFGIRVALGAKPHQVLVGVLRQGVLMAIIGVIFGVAAAAALTRFLRELLFEMNSLDPLTFAAMTLLLFGVTIFACYWPARRATKVDPMAALRYE